MRRLQIILAMFMLLQSVLAAADPEAETGSVQGTVTVLGKNKKPLSGEQVIVTLTPIDASMPLSRREPGTFKIYMRDKTYTPSHLVVQMDDAIYFPNQDRIKHNVFSSSEGNRFDLGSFRRGNSPEVKFKNPGLVKVYCNVHKQMFTYVWVMQADRSMITGEDGFYSIEHLLPGRYTLTAWHVRGEASRTVDVKAGGLVIDVQIDGARWTKRSRPKKSGIYPTEPQKSLNASDWSTIRTDVSTEDDDYDQIDDASDEDDEDEEDEEEGNSDGDQSSSAVDENPVEEQDYENF